MSSSVTPNSDAFPVVVVGAGLAGLTAALTLAERGLPPIVLEADSLWPGGRLAGGAFDTFEHHGRTWSFRTCHGVHALWGGYDNTRAVLKHHLGVDLRLSTGEDWIDRWGREVRSAEAGTAVRYAWLPAPFHYLMLLLRPRFWPTITPLDFLSLPGFLVSILLTLGFDPLREQTPLDGLLMKEYFRGWTRNLRVTFIGLGRNLLAAPDEAIPLASFVAALRFYTMLRRDSWHPEYFAANSHDALVAPMIERLNALGGRVFRGAEAMLLEAVPAATPPYWKIHVDDKTRGGRRWLDAQHVILAVDPPAAQRLLAASPALAERAAELRIPPAVPSVTVRLWFDRAPAGGAPGGMFTGDFPMDNFFWLHRLHDEFKAWHAATGGSAIETHLYGRPGLFEQSDQALLVLVATEVQRAFPALRGRFVHGSVRRNLRTQTLFIIPTADSLGVETPWPGLLACGDWIAHPSPALNMERSVITALEAANSVLRVHDLEPWPIVPPPRPEMLAGLLGGLMRAGRWLLTPPIRGLVRAIRRRSAPAASR